MRTLLLGFALLAANAGTSRADSTQLGIAVLGGSAAFHSEGRTTVIGTGLALSHWIGSLGIAAEGTMMTDPETGSDHGLSAGIGARFCALHTTSIFTSLDGTRTPMRLGLELEAVAQRESWHREDDDAHDSRRTTYSIGIAGSAIGRDRGAVAGFRADLRVVFSPPSEERPFSARMITAPFEQRADIGVIIAIGTELGVAR